MEEEAPVATTSIKLLLALSFFYKIALYVFLGASRNALLLGINFIL